MNNLQLAVNSIRSSLQEGRVKTGKAELSEGWILVSAYLYSHEEDLAGIGSWTEKTCDAIHG